MKSMLKTYKGPVAVPGKLVMKKYAPEELCYLMGVCSGGLELIRRLYERWGEERMSLMDILTTVQDSDLHVSYNLENWRDVRYRLIAALNRAIIFKKFPYMWNHKDPVKREVHVQDDTTNVEYFFRQMGTGQSVAPHAYQGMDPNEVLYQMMYDLSQGLYPMEVVEFEVEDERVESSDWDDDEGEYVVVVERDRKQYP